MQARSDTPLEPAGPARYTCPHTATTSTLAASHIRRSRDEDGPLGGAGILPADLLGCAFGGVVSKTIPAADGLESGSRAQRAVWLASRRKVLSLAPAAFAFGKLLKAESRQERGRRLLGECIEALGGERFLQIRDVVRSGRAYAFYRANVRGLARITIYEHFGPLEKDPEPDWLPVSRREVYTEKGDYYNLFEHGQGWEVTFRGARPLPEERMNRYRNRPAATSSTFCDTGSMNRTCIITTAERRSSTMFRPTPST